MGRRRTRKKAELQGPREWSLLKRSKWLTVSKAAERV